MRSNRKHRSDSTPSTRCRLDVRGRVQGVGFRPFVYRLARALELGGLVGNDVHGAFIEIEGPADRVGAFVGRLRSELPPLARITELSRHELDTRGDSVFRIEHSERTGLQDAEITPDVATCEACLAELFDARDRRYRYPFINCTNCGPRYSIIQAVPYDRPNTTMARFTLCPACQAEYDDPANRRFHAQPNACPVCGPKVWLVNTAGESVPGDPIAECARLLGDGRIVAIKGLGGFHLACRADDDSAVATLRSRKGREAKPLAVMVRDLETARRLATIDDRAAITLSQPERPIVLVPVTEDVPYAGKRGQSPSRGQIPIQLVNGAFKPESCSGEMGTVPGPLSVPGPFLHRLSRHIAPGLDRVGLLLPYTPLHHLLLRAGPGALVMTSGNPTEEPLCCENGEALRRLGHIADAFLLHDRDIERRVDDSVVLAVDRADAPALPIRRARGFAPAPIEIGCRAESPVLAVGGELKSTICVLSGDQAVVSEHLGELPNAVAYRHFLGTIEQFKRLLQVEPAIVAADLHPDYATTRYAESSGLRVVKVQHHHAHLVSCLADNGLSGSAIGIICDGTGYGPDGAIWGCEVLAGEAADYRRCAHVAYYPLPGGDAGARQTWRPAAGLLSQIEGDFIALDPTSFERIESDALEALIARLRRPERLPRTSSLGRLFDAAAFLLGICDRNRYEAEAAMMLEAIARRSGCGAPLPYAIVDGEPMEIDVRPALTAMIERRRAGEDVASLARAFHEMIATMLADAAVRAAGRTGLGRVVLSGGCLANLLLSARLRELLTTAGLQVFEHRQVPPGDGGLALGQAIVAASKQREEVEK